MPIKKTYAEVKSEYDKHGYILVEKEYINQSTKMKCICNNGHHIEITYKSVRKYKGGCKKCGYEKLSKLHSHDYEYAKKIFEGRGYNLLEREYKNERTKMKYRCKKHPNKELSIALYALKKGKGCPYCSKKKVDYALIERELASKGYMYLWHKQVDGQSMIFYSCPKHSGEILHTRPTDLRRGYGCKYCSYEGRKGDNNYNWKGGITKLNKYLRHSAYYWKKEILEEQEQVCFVTKENDETIEIHHLTPFYKVRDEVLKEFGCTGYEEVNNISQRVLEEMRVVLEEKHKKIIGIPLKRSIHQKFHSMYGHDFKESDFWEFVKGCKKEEAH